MQPTYWQLLNDPKVKTIFVTGCGGGFDFVHSMTLIPQLLEANRKVSSELNQCPKRIIIGSYSFGDPDQIQGSEVVWMSVKGQVDEQTPKVRVVDSSCVASKHYGPEVGLCKYLDAHYPLDRDGFARPSEDPDAEEPSEPVAGGHSQVANPTPTVNNWKIFAYYARAFTVISLTDWLVRVCNEYEIDAIVAMDGGSDSLMRGDEAGLGDPIEDAVTVSAVAHLNDYYSNTQGKLSPAASIALNGFSNFRGTVGEFSKRREEFPPVSLTNTDEDPAPILVKPLQVRVLVAIGVGCDRFNGVSDAATLRAIAELSALSEEDPSSQIHLRGGKKNARCGFLGSMALEPSSTGAAVYNDLITFLQSEASFASVIANSICETSNGSGNFGCDVVPAALRANRVSPGELFIWPFMSFHFAFHIPILVKRSFLCDRLLKARSIRAMFFEHDEMRAEMKKKKTLRKDEKLTKS